MVATVRWPVAGQDLSFPPSRVAKFESVSGRVADQGQLGYVLYLGKGMSFQAIGRKLVIHSGSIEILGCRRPPNSTIPSGFLNVVI